MRTKFLIFTLVIATAVIGITYSCKKQTNTDNDKKTVIGLTKKEIKELEAENPTLKIDLNKYHEGQDRYFNSKKDAQKYFDSLRALYRLNVDTVKHAAGVTHGPISAIPLMAPEPCGPGAYHASAGDAGSTSTFYIAFSYGSGGVSGASISVGGLHLFSWSNQNTFYHGNSACSQGDATYTIGIFSWTIVYHVSWTFDPSKCLFYFSQDEGPCGILVTTY